MFFSLETPIAFFIFNRPELTKKVFEKIRQAQPQKLLVVADGARFSEEIEKCQKARDIINSVDWKCEVLTNYSKKNLGCKKRVSSGLDWVFSQVEEAIILEDDCLPAPSFFYFCQTLLEKYRDDKRIMHISGDNFQSGQSRTAYSYYFSKYTHIWGWATWKRAWQHYDVDMKSWSESKKLNLLDSFFSDYYEKEYWTKIFDRVANNEIDTWDYQWLYSCWLQNGLSILPNCNLVSNIGFNAEATHTKSTDNSQANLPVDNTWNMKFPLFITQNCQADVYTFNFVFKGNLMHNKKSITTILKIIFVQIKKYLNSVNYIIKIN